MKSFSIITLCTLILVVGGGCEMSSDDGDSSSSSTSSSSSSGSAELGNAVVIPDPKVPGNLLIVLHDPGNSCDNPMPLGGAEPGGSYAYIKISLAPASQAIGKYSVCDISEWMTNFCTAGPQCTWTGGGAGTGNGTLEITGIDAAQVTFTLGDVGSCNMQGAYYFSGGAVFNGTHTAPRCN